MNNFFNKNQPSNILRAALLAKSYLFGPGFRKYSMKRVGRRGALRMMTALADFPCDFRPICCPESHGVGCVW